jgi:preprotein translocase subunit SecA
MFNELRDRIQGSIVNLIFRVAPVAPPPQAPSVRQVTESGPGEPDGANGAGRRPAPQRRRGVPVVVGAGAVGAPAGGVDPQHKIGRNDPCWCGSGKKYKRCHGR